VRRGWNVTSDPKRTIVTGSSVGGLAAANVALARPDIFGNVLAQSGAFWRGNEGSNDAPFEWLTSQVATLPRRDVRFLLDVGALETIRAVGGRGPVFIEAVRRFRDALVAKGYRVDYTEIAGAAHAPSYWRMRLPEDIVAISRYWTRDSTRASRTHP
jgi:enterochelin esterase family protein